MSLVCTLRIPLATSGTLVPICLYHQVCFQVLITVGYWGGRLAYRALVYQAQNPEFYPQAPQKPRIDKGLSSHWEAEAGWSEFKAKEFNDYVKPRLKKSKMCARVVIR